MWGVILALQSSGAVHLGVDNLGVVRHVGRLLDGHPGSVPFKLVKDGDLLLLIDRMLHLRGLDTVQITKVKCHVDQGMVLDGRVRELDRLGNNAADEAADFGRRRVGIAVIDARRNLSGVCGRWYLVVLALHRFFIAISGAVVNHDGGVGTSIDPLVWSAGSAPKKRLVAVRDRALLPGPPDLWVAVDVPVISSDKFPVSRGSNPLAPDSAHPQSGEHSCCATDFRRIPQVQFLVVWEVVNMPVYVQR